MEYTVEQHVVANQAISGAAAGAAGQGRGGYAAGGGALVRSKSTETNKKAFPLFPLKKSRKDKKGNFQKSRKNKKDLFETKVLTNVSV